MGLKFRFTLFFSSVCLLLLTIFSWLVYVQVRDKSHLQAERDLQALIEHEWDHLDLPSHQAAAKPGTPHFRDVYLRIWKEGNLLYDSFPKGETEVTTIGLVNTPEKIFHTIQRDHNGHKYQVSGFYDLRLLLEHLSFIRRVLFLGCLAALVLIIPLSLFSTQFLLRPFRDLASRTSELNAEKLAFRFKEPANLDEYGMLAKNFNLLLDRLEKSFNQIRTFAVSASHELRTPLSVIIGQGEMALRKSPSDVPQCLSIIQKMLQPAKNLRNVINRLFFLAEVERLEQENQTVVIPVKHAISEVALGLQESYKQSREISVEGADSFATVVANRELFSSIVTNLLENAVKYSAKRVRVRFEKKDSFLNLFVEDDGPGIEVTKREQVFEPFFRVDGKPKVDFSSHGLGLSIVKACVQAEKGTIQLGDSDLGGLSVRVSIPSPA